MAADKLMEFQAIKCWFALDGANLTLNIYESPLPLIPVTPLREQPALDQVCGQGGELDARKTQSNSNHFHPSNYDSQPGFFHL